MKTYVADAEAGDALILVPEVAIGEFVYVSLKGDGARQ